MGKRKISSIRGMSTKRPSTHLPTRRRRGSYLTVTGKFPSSKTPHMVSFEGLRERDFFVLLEYDPDVETFAPHPVRITHRVNGHSRVYTPDVLVTYRKGEDGIPIRPPDLCEVKVRSVLRKDWVRLRPRFRAAQRFSRSQGWRFRLIEEHTIIRPFVSTLHFLLGYRYVEQDPYIVGAIRRELAGAGELEVGRLVGSLAGAGCDAGDVLVHTWHLVSQGLLSVDFGHSLSMRSVVRLQPWTLRETLQQLRTGLMDRKRSGELVEATGREVEGERIGPAGSDVVPIEKGGTYGRRDRPGLYTVLQFLDSESVTVKEHGTAVIDTIPLEMLASLAPRESKGRPDLQDLSDSEIEDAERRYAAIARYLDCRRVRGEEAAAAAAAADVAVKTWRAWLRAYQKNPTLTSLTRRRRKDVGDPRTDERVEDLLKLFVHRWLNSTDTMSSVHRDLEHEVKRRNREYPSPQLRCPAFITFYNRCNALPRHVVVEQRDGKRIARLTHGLQRSRLEETQYPLHIVQIDHTPLPVQVVDAELGIPIGRPFITALIDLFSRMVVGYYLTLEDPGNLSTGMAVSNAILPKKELLSRFGITQPWPCSGRMRILHADNAGEFHGNMLEIACKEYSIDLQYRKVRQPNYGGHIESYLGTLSDALRGLPGATLSGPDEWGDRDPQAEATMTLEDVERWFLWLLMEYHHSEHGGLHGQTPIDRWRDGFRGSSTEPGIGKVFVPSDARKLRLDFLPLEERVVGPKGIVWDHIWYSDPSLQRWVNARDPKNKKNARQFICRRDPRDLSRLYFWDPEIEEYRVIPYRNPTRPALTLWEYRAIRKYLADKGRENIDEDIIFEARQQRRRLLEEARTVADTKRKAHELEKRRRAAEQAAVVHADVGVAAAEPPPTPSNVQADEEDIEPFEDFVG